MELKREKIKLFTKSYREARKLYLSAFPAHERLSYIGLLMNSWRKIANFYAFYDKGEFVGLAYIVANEQAYFILFLAVDTKIQSQGFGSRILGDLKKDASKRPMILTIEPVDESAENSDQRLKRLAFYQRNGFQLTQKFYLEGKERYQIMLTDTSFDLINFEKLMKQFVKGLISIQIQ